MNRLNTRYLLIFVVIIMCLLLGASCQLLPDGGTSSSSNQPDTETPTSIDPDYTLPVGESDAQVLPNFAEVVEKVKPSVVAINTEIITAKRTST